MIGVVVVRDGRCGPGANDVARVANEVWLMGEGLGHVENVPRGVTRCLEVGPYDAASWSAWLAAAVLGAPVVFAAEPDGRDVAGRVAERLEVPAYTGCLELTSRRVVMPRYGGATTVTLTPPDCFVATMQPRTTAMVSHEDALPPVERLDLGAPHTTSRLLSPDLATLDLAEAPRIVAGGAGLSDESDFSRLATLAPLLDAAMGATRVITDRGWVPPRHQIGTTGVTVSPSLYVAFGISGAVQHTAGLGSPSHVISVNTDDACPMSLMADVALVSDAAATLRALDELVRASS